MNRTIFGGLESVSIVSLNVHDVTAKVDTGAWSGALHCTKIYQEDGVLYFTPLGQKQLATSTSDFIARHVRSASGHKQSRYVIPVKILINNTSYKTTIGLADRKLMKREMLLGRRFLIEHNILVDVSLTVEDDEEAKEDL